MMDAVPLKEFIYLYYLTQIFFILGALIWFKKEKGIYSFLCCIGFLMFFLCNLSMLNIDSNMIESKLTNNIDLYNYQKDMYAIAFATASIGLFLAGASFFAAWYRK